MLTLCTNVYASRRSQNLERLDVPLPGQQEREGTRIQVHLLQQVFQLGPIGISIGSIRHVRPSRIPIHFEVLLFLLRRRFLHLRRHLLRISVLLQRNIRILEWRRERRRGRRGLLQQDFQQRDTVAGDLQQPL